MRCPPIPINPFLAHRRGLSFRNLSVEVVRRDAALKTLCIMSNYSQCSQSSHIREQE